MHVLHERCWGLDIHKTFVVACLLATSPDGAVEKEIRTYSAMTNDLLALVTWRKPSLEGRRVPRPDLIQLRGHRLRMPPFFQRESAESDRGHVCFMSHRDR